MWRDFSIMSNSVLLGEGWPRLEGSAKAAVNCCLFRLMARDKDQMARFHAATCFCQALDADILSRPRSKVCNRLFASLRWAISGMVKRVHLATPDVDITLLTEPSAACLTILDIRDSAWSMACRFAELG